MNYNGITQRAVNTKVLALVDQWQSSIEIYRSLKTKLPNDWTCLGNDVGDFPEMTAQGIGLGQCERNFIVRGQPSDWTSEFKTTPTEGQTLSTPELLRANTSLADGGLDMYKDSSNGYMRGIVYASISDSAIAPQGMPGAFIFYTLRGEACRTGFELRTIGEYKVCAIRLTSANYVNEIYQP